MSQCHVGPLPWQVHMHVMTFVLLSIITGLMGFTELFAAHWKLSISSIPKGCHVNECLQQY